MTDSEMLVLSPAFQGAWEKANRIGNKKRQEERARLLSDISRSVAFALLARKELSEQEIRDNGLFCSVTNKVNKTKKPGRFVKPSSFEKTQLSGGGIESLHSAENINPGLVGITVDYLTRLMTGDTPEATFKTPLMGAYKIDNLVQAEDMLGMVKGLDDTSICSAVQLACFDVVYRAGEAACIPFNEVCPDDGTVDNIRIMVNRSLNFFSTFGPKTADHLTFEGGYTGHVTHGDGDFLTEDTLWDFKVSKQNLQSRSVLQLLIYWRLGVHSIHSEYQNVKYLGIYNPRMNIVY